MGNQKEYTISEIADITGISPSALRYYDKEGLLPNVKRSNGRRVFTDADFGTLKVLICLKNAGLPIREIKHFFELSRQGDMTLQERYGIILKQKEAIHERIDVLRNNLKELEYKEWYFRTALEAGTESVHAGRPCSPGIEPDIIPDSSSENSSPEGQERSHE